MQQLDLFEGEKMQVNIEELVSAYLKIRTEREILAHNYEQEDAALKADMAEIEQMMLTSCNEINADSIKTAKGTVMRSVKERFTCSDWDSFYKFVMEHQAPQLLEKRIHQGNFKTFYNEEEGLPPGVNVMREYGITVRKPSN
jgi:hypothetical protein